MSRIDIKTVTGSLNHIEKEIRPDSNSAKKIEQAIFKIRNVLLNLFSFISSVKKFSDRQKELSQFTQALVKQIVMATPDENGRYCVDIIVNNVVIKLEEQEDRSILLYSADTRDSPEPVGHYTFKGLRDRIIRTPALMAHLPPEWREAREEPAAKRKHVHFEEAHNKLHEFDSMIQPRETEEVEMIEPMSEEEEYGDILYSGTAAPTQHVLYTSWEELEVEPLGDYYEVDNIATAESENLAAMPTPDKRYVTADGQLYDVPAHLYTSESMPAVPPPLPEKAPVEVTDDAVIYDTPSHQYVITDEGQIYDVPHQRYPADRKPGQPPEEVQDQSVKKEEPIYATVNKVKK
ncbi:MAG: hypothetical protein ACRC5A_01850 [Enterobacteriaceae bacterium]